MQALSTREADQSSLLDFVNPIKYTRFLMIILTRKKNFTDLRLRAGFETQRQLANQLKNHHGLSISFQTISGWETGKWKPELSPSAMKILLEVLHCTLDELAEAFEDIEDD